MQNGIPFSSDRDRIRTCDRLLRRQMLYPAELLDHLLLLYTSRLRRILDHLLLLYTSRLRRIPTINYNSFNELLTFQYF